VARQIRRPGFDESKSGPVRIRQAVGTGLPYGPTTWCVGARVRDSATTGASRSRPAGGQRPDRKDLTGTTAGTPRAARRIAVVRVAVPAVVPPLGHG
jgi:hypothetical protein